MNHQSTDQPGGFDAIDDGQEIPKTSNHKNKSSPLPSGNGASEGRPKFFILPHVLQY